MEKIINCFCAWFDLKGFGKVFEDSNWDLNNPVAKQNLERIRNFNTIARNMGMANFEKVLILNDGCARIYDETESSVNIINLGYWLSIIYSAFSKINGIEKENGLPGLRGVISFGQRLDLNEGDVFTNTRQFVFDEKYNEDHKNDIFIYNPLQFQMNLAFSKSYLIESLGQKKGITGNHLYIDELILTQISEGVNNPCEFLNYTETTQSEEGEFSATFELKTDTFRIDDHKNGDYRTFNLVSSDGNIFYGFTFDITPIYIEERGLNTNVYRLKEFHSIKPPTI